MTPPSAEQLLASRLFRGPALRTQPDQRLVTLVRDGYETAFEEIVRRYAKPLGRYAAAIVGGRSEDITQEAFSKALPALRSAEAEIELRPWLYRIVRNTALNHLRDRPPAPEALADGIADGRGLLEEIEQREELAELLKRLRALPEPQRAAIVMRELEGLGHEEIATALGVSGGAARQAIYRARQALRNGLGMLVPLPVLKAMLAGAAGPLDAATGAAGAAGAGLALKVGAATVLVAGAVGAGVALHNGRGVTESPATAGAASGGAARPSTRVTERRPHSRLQGSGPGRPVANHPEGRANGTGARNRAKSGTSRPGVAGSGPATDQPQHGFSPRFPTSHESGGSRSDSQPAESGQSGDSTEAASGGESGDGSNGGDGQSPNVEGESSSAGGDSGSSSDSLSGDSSTGASSESPVPSVSIDASSYEQSPAGE